KCRDHRTIGQFREFLTKKTSLSAWVVGGVSPRFVAPECRESLQHAGWDSLGPCPQGVSVDVHDGKVEKQINGSHLASHRHDRPIELKTIGIKQAESTTSKSIGDRWENLTKKYPVAVAFSERHITPIADDLS